MEAADGAAATAALAGAGAGAWRIGNACCTGVGAGVAGDAAAGDVDSGAGVGTTTWTDAGAVGVTIVPVGADGMPGVVTCGLVMAGSIAFGVASAAAETDAGAFSAASGAGSPSSSSKSNTTPAPFCAGLSVPAARSASPSLRRRRRPPRRPRRRPRPPSPLSSPDAGVDGGAEEGLAIGAGVPFTGATAGSACGFSIFGAGLGVAVRSGCGRRPCADESCPEPGFASCGGRSRRCCQHSLRCDRPDDIPRPPLPGLPRCGRW